MREEKKRDIYLYIYIYINIYIERERERERERSAFDIMEYYIVEEKQAMFGIMEARSSATQDMNFKPDRP